MAKQHFLQQAQTYKKGKHDIFGWWGTPKLDGIRCFWDGGVTRGMKKSDVPWANNDKDERYKTAPVSSGLWTRYGNCIAAPDWWLDSLPKIPMDGEIWAGRGRHQFTRSTVLCKNPDERWEQIKLGVFNSPNLAEIFFDRDINITSYKKQYRNILEWLLNRDIKSQHKPYMEMTYGKTIEWLMVNYPESKSHHVIRPAIITSQDKMEEFYQKELSLGGEGVIFTDPKSVYKCERTHSQVKEKPFLTDEATIIGIVSGKVTDKDSRNRGKIGSLIVETSSGKILHLSGLTDKERELKDEYRIEYAWNNPGVRIPMDSAKHFNFGEIISYKYRELTDDGIPKEASYFRKREVE